MVFERTILHSLRSQCSIYSLDPPMKGLMLWSVLVGIWGILKGSCGVLVQDGSTCSHRTASNQCKPKRRMAGSQVYQWKYIDP